MTRLELGTLSVDLDALDELAGWLASAATAHDAAGTSAGAGFGAGVDWRGASADAGALAHQRWESRRLPVAEELRTLASAARRASQAYAAAAEHAERLWAQVLA